MPYSCTKERDACVDSFAGRGSSTESKRSYGPARLESTSSQRERVVSMKFGATPIMAERNANTSADCGQSLLNTAMKNMEEYVGE